MQVPRTDLDFISTIKLINFIRSEVRCGRMPQRVTSRESFDDDKYLQPTLADDAVLFSLEDVLDMNTKNPNSEADALKEELAEVKLQFANYRLDVQQTFASKIDAEVVANRTSRQDNSPYSRAQADRGTRKRHEMLEDDYFQSYSYNSIHESMLKDTVRTDAYRDFIYDNKHLFADKVVLDVGCGTGILSMFCAKAGAKLVVSVDNSDIIDKARKIVFDNGLQHRIKCLRGKVEEVTLPVPQVDVIVSEWMGYCLLFESMLDSVIFARDRYLSPDGLMVPSHATIVMAPLCNSQLTEEHVEFWREVYGFDMSAMLDNVYDEGLTRAVEQSEIASNTCQILQLDLYQATVTGVDFQSSFSLRVEKGPPVRLEGFVIWFDIFFLSGREKHLEPKVAFELAKRNALVAFSTSPASHPTHWQHGVFLINGTEQLVEDELLEGMVSFRKKRDQDRSLEIDIEWGKKSRKQSWSLG